VFAYGSRSLPHRSQIPDHPPIDGRNLARSGLARSTGSTARNRPPPSDANGAKNERQDQPPVRRLRLDRLSRLSHARCCHRGKPHQSGDDSGARAVSFSAISSH